MDPQADSDEEFVVLSTSDYTEPASAAGSKARSVTNYYINGGFGGSGGEGRDQGAPGTGTIRISDNSTGGYKTDRRIQRNALESSMECYGAEETWNQHLANYESIRHPNVMQLYGLVSTKGIYAMIFHDELIPYAQFRRRFQHSAILTPYIIGYCTTQFWEATHFLSGVSRKPSTDYLDLPGWIQPRKASSASTSLSELLPNSWTRYDSRQTPHLHLMLSLNLYELLKAWLAQANSILTELQERAHVEDYVCVDYLRCWLIGCRFRLVKVTTASYGQGAKSIEPALCTCVEISNDS
ncbi:hypothetical protein MSAN_02380100 [Mycena sanguinolenta]|uniref:Protein kinase domain-containing protein n=1 Tax=Mycena sanguinolenta TaxID=230812 RepID=A0A8H6X4J9_9AGAR|nr:hypothetical protein MSAN_02380100 [Mycena sanguinolenta]